MVKKHAGFAGWESLMAGLGLMFPDAPSPIPELLIIGGIAGVLVWLYSLEVVRNSIPMAWPYRGRISLARAAKKVYEKTEGSMLQIMAEQYVDCTIEQSYANHIVNGPGREPCIPVFGKKPPATRFVQVHPEHWLDGQVNESATVLEPRFGKQPRYVDLEIRRSDLKRRLIEITAGDLGRPSGNG